MTAPRPSFNHVARLTDRYGMSEHADHTTPREGGGSCTDDMARLLVVTCRETDPDARVLDLAHTALRFLADAQGVTGNTRSRRNRQGRWLGRRTVEDSWGRSLWGLGTAVARSPHDWMRQDALARFERGATQRSPWTRAMAFAGLGAAEVLVARPGHRSAMALLADASAVMGRPGPDASWPWPEARLRYANAVIPEVLLAAGHALARPQAIDDGLTLLGWLLDHETSDGHLSVTPVGGNGPGDTRPAFDQQPIEVAAIADACARAFQITGDERWSRGVTDAIAWFLGDNDAHTSMLDAVSGGGYDGLELDGANQNEGAESTLALISTLQHARRFAPAEP